MGNICLALVSKRKQPKKVSSKYAFYKKQVFMNWFI